MSDVTITLSETEAAELLTVLIGDLAAATRDHNTPRASALLAAAAQVQRQLFHPAPRMAMHPDSRMGR